MAMGRRKPQQESFWIATAEIATPATHPFYQRLNQLLDASRFDHCAEQLCRRFYAAKRGRPSLAPGVYFRALMMGFFEGIESERGIAWRLSDSLALRSFLGMTLTEATPDHSTISRTRRLLPLETHRAVFRWVLKRVAEQGLLKNKTIGIDATTLEANAALKSIVQRDTGESYQDYLQGLAEAAGMVEPTAAELARFDRRRQGRRTSNQDWKSPHDEEARITKRKDGRTHFAYKAEHAADLETGVVTAVVIAAGDAGDSATLAQTLAEAGENTAELVALPADAGAAGPYREVYRHGLSEVVTDKGYHSDRVLGKLSEAGVRSYVSEPERPARSWEGKAAERPRAEANKRRVGGERGKGLLRQRGEFLERGFAHCYDTGGMRRVWLRGQTNVAKRVLIQVAAFNLSVILRAILGAGKPRELGGRDVDLLRLILSLLGKLTAEVSAVPTAGLANPAPELSFRLVRHRHDRRRENGLLTTGC